MVVGKLSITWWGFTAFTVFIIACVLLLTYIRDSAAALRLIRIIALIIFSYKGTYYLYKMIIDRDIPDSIPIEYSHIAFLLIGIAFLFKIKPLYDFTAFMSFVAGFGNLISILLYSNSFLHNTVFDIIISILFHGGLFLAGVLYLTKVKRLRVIDAWQFYLGSILIVGYSELLYNTVCGHMTIFLIELTHGRILPFTLFPYLKDIFNMYYLLDIIVLFSFAVALVYIINRVAYRRHSAAKSSKDCSVKSA